MNINLHYCLLVLKLLLNDKGDWMFVLIINVFKWKIKDWTKQYDWQEYFLKTIVTQIWVTG